MLVRKPLLWRPSRSSLSECQPHKAGPSYKRNGLPVRVRDILWDSCVHKPHEVVWERGVNPISDVSWWTSLPVKSYKKINIRYDANSFWTHLPSISACLLCSTWCKSNSVVRSARLIREVSYGMKSGIKQLTNAMRIMVMRNIMAWSASTDDDNFLALMFPCATMLRRVDELALKLVLFVRRY